MNAKYYFTFALGYCHELLELQLKISQMKSYYDVTSIYITFKNSHCFSRPHMDCLFWRINHCFLINATLLSGV